MHRLKKDVTLISPCGENHMCVAIITRGRTHTNHANNVADAHIHRYCSIKTMALVELPLTYVHTADIA